MAHSCWLGRPRGVRTDHVHDETARYRLVIFEAIAEKPPPVRDLFCRVTGMHPTDVVQWLALVPGRLAAAAGRAGGSQAARRSL